jgi:hypothetical protein
MDISSKKHSSFTWGHKPGRQPPMIAAKRKRIIVSHLWTLFQRLIGDNILRKMASTWVGAQWRYRRNILLP